MNFGWALLINGAIGFIVYPITWTLFMKWCDRKWGKKQTERGLDDALEMSDELGRRAVSDFSLWRVICYFATFFLWEIEVPSKCLMLYRLIQTKNAEEDENGSL